MMPTIRLDDDVFKGLQQLAKPFVDSPSSVVRRLLEERGILKPQKANGTGEARSRVFPRRPVGTTANGLTPQPIYEDYLLFVLAKELNGRGHKRDATHAVIKRMMKDGHVGAADQELVSTGETKAENTIAWARNALKDRGFISRISPHGIWELTPEGKSAAGKVVLPKPGQVGAVSA
ncbi:MAG: winged helix-turn-helix domain-containing protein [Pseudomonadota bacterium]